MHWVVKGSGAIVLAIAFVAALGEAGRERSVAQEGETIKGSQTEPQATVLGDAISSEPPSDDTTALEEAILEAFSGDEDRSPEEEKRWRQSVDYVSASINVKGYLCAIPYEMLKVDQSHYGIGCITNRDGTGQSNYLVNVRTGAVEPI
ncbi:hypothetical protein [Erythrobacter sp. JK5]|uniref:hypothetical protein n=1 Tax=Erythrobacter sp. JK5 TaxID=2829500 RepID=UPI001BA70191|nr:hypothetical protein [Erythrobacter sp. JK5]QUL36820.1 hypothetical protein KDC96_10365 [Erythrobacter sp. JK5]